jgi:hypothetical protein
MITSLELEVTDGVTVGVSINVWRPAGDTLNITCNFRYCNHQLHRFFDHPVPPSSHSLLHVLGSIVARWKAGNLIIQGDQKVCVHLMITVQKTRSI